MRLRLLISLTIILFFGQNALADGRVALVIGNSRYVNVGELPNPTSDAAAIGETLSRLGFKVTRLNDLGINEMREALLDFSDAAADSDMAVVFYAGHGMEMDKQNYLVPVDAELKTDRSVNFEAVHLDLVSEAVSGAKELRLIILDACRDNPFLSKIKVTRTTRSISRGLARVDPEAGTLIAFAASEGSVASDGAGEHSPFTQALLDVIEEPGLEIDFLFRKVRDRVMAETDGDQQPFRYGSLPGRAIYLKPPEASAAAKLPEDGLPPQTEAAEAWFAVKDSNSIAVLEAFNTRYGSTFFGEMARIRIDELREAAPAQSVQEQAAVALVPKALETAPRLSRTRSFRLASAIPGRIPVLGALGDSYSGSLSELSDGKLKVEFFDPGSLVGAFDTFDAVREGKVDFGWANSAYWAGKEPAMLLLSGAVPFGMTPEKLVAWNNGEGGKLRDKVFARHNLKSLACGIAGPESGGWFRKEIRSVDDIKGLRFRINGLGGEVAAMSGMQLMFLPGGEIYPALERGTIDGAKFSVPSADLLLGLNQVAPFYYYPGWHQPATMLDLFIGLGTWNSLKDEERQAIELACARQLREALHDIATNQSEGLDGIRRLGLEIRSFPDDVLAVLRRNSDAVLKEKAGGNALFAEVLESYDRHR